MKTLDVNMLGILKECQETKANNVQSSILVDHTPFFQILVQIYRCLRYISKESSRLDTSSCFQNQTPSQFDRINFFNHKRSNHLFSILLSHEIFCAAPQEGICNPLIVNIVLSDKLQTAFDTINPTDSRFHYFLTISWMNSRLYSHIQS